MYRTQMQLAETLAEKVEIQVQEIEQCAEQQ
jgi:hypothetical protein